MTNMSDIVKKEPADSSSDDDVPLAKKLKAKRHHNDSENEDTYEPKPKLKKIKQEMSINGDSKHKKKKDKEKKKKKPEKSLKPAVKKPTNSNSTRESLESPTKKRGKTKEDEAPVWKWWEEDRPGDGNTKWKFLEHCGPVFAPEYEPLPSQVKFKYAGQVMKLSPEAEETAGFYAKMLDHDYTSKDVFNENFFTDWRKTMTADERKTITTLTKCDFKEMHKYFQQQSEERKAWSKEQKQKLKDENLELVKKYGFCTLDGHKQRIGNFRIEPPGLFRGRGQHPKMGMLKKRLQPENVIINCSKDSKIPAAPPGHKWKEVRHDNTVTWLACWIENVQGNFKYIMLNASSRLKAEKDWNKFENARKLHKVVDSIRAQYRRDWKSKEMRLRQRSVALYFIDKLALRAGNEKEEDEADTVGCCSLRYEHISLHKELNGKSNVVQFDFLGKDSIRYYNEVSVEKRVFKNLKLFKENKKAGDDLFDRLNTTILNQYLRELSDGLTAKVFRTYNASLTLEQQLDLLTDPKDNEAAKILSYNRANRAVAILCNHQRAVPKTFEKSMENLENKIGEKRKAIHAAKKAAKLAKVEAKKEKSAKSKQLYDKKKTALKRLQEQLHKLEVQKTDKGENKEIALGTSKLNYLDPRISVAWCKKFGVPVEKVYNKTQREKFQWALDMATADYRFQDLDSDAISNKMKLKQQEEEDGDEDENEEDDE